MGNVFTWIFALSFLLIAHTYVIYPVVMLVFFRNKKDQTAQYGAGEELPVVAVLIAAYNEEKVIREKISSVFNCSYPPHKLKVYVGSDASADNTEKIVSGMMQEHPNLELVKFTGRVGKISIINHLQSLGDENILIMTDANVIFRTDTIYELIKMFKDDKVGIVAANIVKVSSTNEGIALQEKKYLSLENRIKAGESNAFNFIMGAEGGCYAIRNSLFSKVPLKFIVDDFFITMQVIIRGRYTLFNPAAICIEDVAADPTGEYQRKVRISSGNFQNLLFFRKVLCRFWKPLGFAFWSHKVLRWLTPFFLISALLSTAVLSFSHHFFAWMLVAQVLGMLLPLLDMQFNFKNHAVKFVSHFYLMNLALLQGFFRFTRGIKSSVWQPVKRNV